MPKITQDDVDKIAEEVQRTAAETPTQVPTELAIVTPQSLATGEQPVGVSGEADPTDFVLPYLAIVQKSGPTSESHKPGLLLKTTGEESEAVTFVILHVARTRTYYDGENAALLCASRDRVTGWPAGVFKTALDDQGIMGNLGSLACRICPHYGDDQFQKLACKYDYLLTLFDLSAEEPFLFRARGASLKTWRQRLSPILTGNQPPWFTSFEMTVVTRTNQRQQSWYEPELRPLARYDAATRAVWAAYAEQFGNTVIDEPDADDLPFE